jgi:molybdopterin-guanine dinucleotide biosynthesis protein A
VFDDVVVAGGSTAPPGCVLLVDAYAGAGPLAGLDAAFDIAEGRAVFLMAVDMPFVDPATVRSIVEPPVDPTAARVPVTGERRQPLCAVYGSGLGPLVKRCLERDDRSMAKLIAAVDAVEYLDVDARTMTNVNTAADLAAALRESDPPRSTR